MAALLVAVAVMTVAMTVAMPAWKQAVRREREEELVFRGRQYVRALQLYQRKFVAAYPPDIDTLVNQKFLRKKFKDPMVEDGEFEILYQGSRVMVNIGPGGVSQGQRSGQPGGPASTFSGSVTFDSGSGAITQGSPGRVVGGTTVGGPRGGVIGVRSTSTAESIRIYSGATHYNEWLFVFVPANVGRGQVRPGPGGGVGPGTGGGAGPGQRGGRGGPGGPSGPGPGYRGGRGPGR